MMPIKTIEFERYLRNEMQQTLVDVAKENRTVLGMFYSYKSKIQSAINKDSFIKKEIQWIKDMFSEENLIKVPILKNYSTLQVNRLIAYTYSKVNDVPDIVFGKVIHILLDDIKETMNCDSVLFPFEKIGNLTPEMICMEIKEFLCLGVGYAQIYALLEQELSSINGVINIKDDIAEIREAVAKSFPKIKWAGSGRQLYDLFKQLYIDKLIVNTKEEIADFILENIKWEKGIKPGKSTILTELNRPDSRPMKGKRIKHPGKE